MNTNADLPLPGLLGLLGISIRHLSAEAAFPDIEGTLAIHEDLLAPTGYPHAATVVALADTAAGYGCLASLPEHATGFTTIELKCNVLSAGAVDDTCTVLATAPDHPTARQ
jgi:acyl-coenzyme A thioesterase PaaI-like protein